MIHSATEIIAAVMRELGNYTDPEEDGPWPVVINQMPDQPDDMIGIFSSDLPSSGRLHRTGETIGSWGWQVRVRGRVTVDARQKALELGLFFDSIRQLRITVDDSIYFVYGIHQETRASYIGPDENNRPNFTINGRVTFRKIEVA